MKLLFPELALEHKEIKGLELIEDFVNIAQEQQILEIIDQQKWICELKRRVQHYGYRYDYKKNTVLPIKIGLIPSWLEHLCEVLVEKKICEVNPDQIIINE